MTKWSVVRRGAALVGLVVAVGAAAAAAQEAPFRWSGALAKGKVLEVKGISGSIRAERASGTTAEVVAEKDGRSSDFGAVEIRTEENADGIVVCAVYHPERYEEKGCDVGRSRRDDRGRDRERSINVQVDFVVKLPDGVKLVASQVSGDVDARDLHSDVTANSVSGDITLVTTGVAEARTVSGSLDIEMASLDWKRLSFKTVSGDITLRLPSEIAAAVDFESLSGDLDTDFALALQGRQQRRWVGAHIQGTIGDGGGRSLELNTVSGDVTLRRAR
jgi:hypothetical protein